MKLFSEKMEIPPHTVSHLSHVGNVGSSNPNTIGQHIITVPMLEIHFCLDSAFIAGSAD